MSGPTACSTGHSIADLEQKCTPEVISQAWLA